MEGGSKEGRQGGGGVMDRWKEGGSGGREGGREGWREGGREGGREKRETATQTHHNIRRIARKSEMLL